MTNMSAFMSIVRQGMDDYWKAVKSPTDNGLNEVELRWKRDYERTCERMAEKFKDFDWSKI